MPAMSASEQRLMLDTAFASRPLRRVIAVLDFNGFAGAPDARETLAGPLPRHLYDRNPLNDFGYVLSGDVLMRSVRILRPDATRSDSSECFLLGLGRLPAENLPASGG